MWSFAYFLSFFQAIEEIEGLTDTADSLIKQKTLMSQKQSQLIKKVSNLSGWWTVLNKKTYLVRWSALQINLKHTYIYELLHPKACISQPIHKIQATWCSLQYVAVFSLSIKAERAPWLEKRLVTWLWKVRWSGSLFIILSFYFLTTFDLIALGWLESWSANHFCKAHHCLLL